jgi:hypothetical protein
MREHQVVVALVGAALEVELELAGEPIGERDRSASGLDFGVVYPPRTYARRTRTLAASQSMSDQRRASSSPRRRPVHAAVKNSVRSVSAKVPARTLRSRASSSDSSRYWISASRPRLRGFSTIDTGLAGTQPHRTA